MQTWIKFCPPDELIEGKSYFIGCHRNPGDQYHEHCDLLGRGLNQKVQWTQKPGIAIIAEGGDKLREYLKKDPAFKAVEIPSDADKRWKARKPVQRGYRQATQGATGESK